MLGRILLKNNKMRVRRKNYFFKKKEL